MREIVLKEAVELKVPAEQNMMLVLRLTTAGVVARAGLTVDRMDDVKMAVEEACSCGGGLPPGRFKSTASRMQSSSTTDRMIAISCSWRVFKRPPPFL